MLPPQFFFLLLLERDKLIHDLHTCKWRVNRREKNQELVNSINKRQKKKVKIALKCIDVCWPGVGYNGFLYCPWKIRYNHCVHFFNCAWKKKNEGSIQKTIDRLLNVCKPFHEFFFCCCCCISDSLTVIYHYVKFYERRRNDWSDNNKNHGAYVLLAQTISFPTPF